MESDDVSFLRSLLTWEFALFISASVGVIVVGMILSSPNEWVYIGGIASGAILDQLDDKLSSHAEERLSEEESEG